MVDEPLREQIREAYQRLTDSLDLKPRWGQRQMIAEVANALGDAEAETPIAVVEAGTGTGKTIAYLVAALPIARARGKRLGARGSVPGNFQRNCSPRAVKKLRARSREFSGAGLPARRCGG